MNKNKLELRNKIRIHNKLVNLFNMLSLGQDPMILINVNYRRLKNL